jgi:hypothetical protein
MNIKDKYIFINKLNILLTNWLQEIYTNDLPLALKSIPHVLHIILLYLTIMLLLGQWLSKRI